MLLSLLSTLNPNVSTHTRGFWGLLFSSETLFSFFSTATALSEGIELEPSQNQQTKHKDLLNSVIDMKAYEYESYTFSPLAYILL